MNRQKSNRHTTFRTHNKKKIKHSETLWFTQIVFFCSCWRIFDINTTLLLLLYYIKVSLLFRFTSKTLPNYKPVYENIAMSVRHQLKIVHAARRKLPLNTRFHGVPFNATTFQFVSIFFFIAWHIFFCFFNAHFTATWIFIIQVC